MPRAWAGVLAGAAAIPLPRKPLGDGIRQRLFVIDDEDVSGDGTVSDLGFLWHVE